MAPYLLIIPLIASVAIMLVILGALILRWLGG